MESRIVRGAKTLTPRGPQTRPPQTGEDWRTAKHSKTRFVTEPGKENGNSGVQGKALAGGTPSSEWPCQPAGICKAESGAGLEGVGQQGEAFLSRDRKFINSSVPPAILIDHILIFHIFQSLPVKPLPTAG